MPKKSEPNQTWTFQVHNDMVSEIRFKLRSNAEPVRMLCLSDLHWDNPKCDRQLLRSFLDDAVRYNAPVLLIGDTFCCMQGKYDKRSNKADIRPEHQKGDYFDALVRTAAEWFRPYAKNIAIIGYGNHENSVLDRHETDLLDRLAYKLREHGGATQATGYQGFLLSSIEYGGKNTRTEVGYYHHGYGGGGPVTKGTIDFSRYGTQARADYYLAGHIHRLNTDISRIFEVDTVKKVVHGMDIDYVRMSTPKEDGMSPNGWHTERGMGPRPLGGWWCEWVVRSSHKQSAVVTRSGNCRVLTAKRRFVRAI